MKKILCVGFQKTGTTSLGIALKKLGYNTTGWLEQTASIYKQGHADALLAMAKDFDAFEDLPWYLMYKEFYNNFPDSMFILTLRKDYDTWFNSLDHHVNSRGINQFSFLKLVYGTVDLKNSKDHIIETLKQHVSNVRTFAKSNNIPLLEMCMEEGDGWAKLCSFLNVKVPNEPFPHANKAVRTRGFLPTLLRRALRFSQR